MSLIYCGSAWSQNPFNGIESEREHIKTIFDKEAGIHSMELKDNYSPSVGADDLFSRFLESIQWN
jgi:hypothetical protein